MWRIALCAWLCCFGSLWSRRNQKSHHLFNQIEWILIVRDFLFNKDLIEDQLRIMALCAWRCWFGKNKVKTNIRTHLLLFIRIEWILNENKTIVRDFCYKNDNIADQLRRIALCARLCCIGKVRSRRTQKSHDLFIRIELIMNKNKEIVRDCLME